MAKKRPRKWNQIIVLFAVALACSIISYSHSIKFISSMALPEDVDLDAPFAHQRRASYQPLNEAEFIIQKSYAETYGRMHHCNDSIIEKDCIALVMQHMHQNQNATTTTTALHNKHNPHFQVPSNHPYPWWFETLIRDVPTNGAYGFWHHFSTISTKPPIRFCAIGKNGSTEWRRIFKALNAPEFCNEGGIDGDGECKSKFNTASKLSDDPAKTPRTVFIRDPLERLLSAYLDKCAKPNVRIGQGHCEPNVVFGIDHLERKARQEVQQKQKRRQNQRQAKESLPDLTDALDGKEMFAAYVDLLPLKWNVHFVPQALFCDLYRTIDTYDFVGVMGRQFLSELDRLANRYGGMLPEVLDDTFQYQSKLNNQSISENIGSENAHGTKAPAKVAKYYSPKAVRRALEYLSIDYVTLGLDVPEWAKEMLHDDSR